MELGFLKNRLNGLILKQIHTKIDNWNCLETIFAFNDFEYTKYNNL